MLKMGKVHSLLEISWVLLGVSILDLVRLECVGSLMCPEVLSIETLRESMG